MRQHGFEPNLDKSAMVCRHALPDHSPIISTRSSNEEFVMLGVNITPNYDTFNVKQLRKIDTFFDLVDSLQMHPEATHKILHFCGDRDLCSTHLPRLQNSAGVPCNASTNEHYSPLLSSSTWIWKQSIQIYCTGLMELQFRLCREHSTSLSIVADHDADACTTATGGAFPTNTPTPHR